MEHARKWLREAESVAVLTGAGISAESGIPTFRGAGGLWKTYRPEQLATPEAFKRDPRLVWEWYEWRRGLIAKAQPNAGHVAIAQLEQRKKDFLLITQNVDGLHDRAGSRRLVKLHGDIWRLRCLDCGSEWEDRRVPLPQLPPECRCGGTARPGVVWFGEPMPPVWEEAETFVRRTDVTMVAGTSASVYPAAGLVPLARQSGSRVIEINLEETAYSGLVDASLIGKSGEILPALIGF